MLASPPAPEHRKQRRRQRYLATVAFARSKLLRWRVATKLRLKQRRLCKAIESAVERAEQSVAFRLWAAFTARQRWIANR